MANFKKNYLTLSLLFAGAACCALSSCSKDDDTITKSPDMPTQTNGAFILNQGSYSSNVEGELSLISYDGTISSDLFRRANGRSLGNTPQCGLVYGDKMYIGVCYSSTVEILSKKDFKSIKQIRCSDASTGTQPRSMVAQNGYVYISMFDGYLARLDTATLTIDKAVKVGPNPENICIHNNKIYVPNSDGMNYMEGYGTTASVISLPDFTVEKTIEVPLNPNKFLSANGKLYLLANGDYYSIMGALYEIKDEGDKTTSTKLLEATMAAEKYPYIYTANAVYMQPVTYAWFNTTSNEIKNWEAPEVVSPCGLGVDPLNGNIFVTSYVQNGYMLGYDIPGYTVEYDANGKFVKQFETGVGPSAIFFNLD